MKINVIGRVQVYEPSGSYSIIIEKAEPDGVGALAIQFEQLKKKPTEEGLFPRTFQATLPQFSVSELVWQLVAVELLFEILSRPSAGYLQVSIFFLSGPRFKVMERAEVITEILRVLINGTTWIC